MTPVDPGLSYCPQCNQEYRAGFLQCSDCRVALVSCVEKLSELQGEIGDSDRLVTIRRGKLRDMKTLQRVLEKARIPSLLTSETAGRAKG